MSNTKTVMGQASNQYVAPVNVEDVFSTYLYDGNGSTQTITNGLDLGGEGGLVWIKKRNESINSDHMLFDTERGPNERLRSNTTDQQYTRTDQLNSFDSSGFTLGGDSPASPNNSGKEYASWSFRKAPKFFTCLTYSGTGPGSGANEQQVSHDLGAKPGIVIIKRTDATGDWWVFTDVIDGSNDYGYLNQTAAFGNSANNVATDSVFNVGGILNTSGATYVAYLFASNDGDGEFGPTGDQDIIKCGSYTATGSPVDVNLGFEPQFIITRNVSRATEWNLQDTMRGMTDNSWTRVIPNDDSADFSVTSAFIFPTATGFKVTSVGNEFGNAGDTVIYIAIRRGTKVPESGTEVFDVHRTTDNASTGAAFDVGFVSDFAWHRETDATAVPYTFTRLLGGRYYLRTDGTNAEGDSTVALGYDWTLQNSVENNVDGGFPHIFYNWKRAPGYFDAVAYTGDGVAGRTVSHNLTVAPEMMWIKKRSGAYEWIVYSPAGDGYLRLNTTEVYATSNVLWNATSPTSTEFTLGGYTHVNGSGEDYIAYLFASLPGISKVGSFTHSNGSNTTVDCGFTSGARFVLVKQTDLADGWFVFDTERGITVSDSPRLFLNSTASEFGASYIEPVSSGFIIKNGFWSAGDYIFYAIA